MNYKLLLISLFPLLLFAQRGYDRFSTNDELINSYYHSVDSISNDLSNRNDFNNLTFSYRYVNTVDNYKNVITANYWTNGIHVNFVFNGDNLSYLTPDAFDKFRRNFYKEKTLNLLVDLDDKQLKDHFLKISALNKTITCYKNEDYITTTVFFKEKERFLIFEYYLNRGDLMKIKIRETNSEFQWDMINYFEFYYKNSKIVFRKFYQSLMDGQFRLDSKFNENELQENALKILNSIKNN